jgi:hypothetical protein
MFDKLFHIKGGEYSFLAIQYGRKKKVFLLWLKGTNLLTSRGQAIFPFYREYLSSVAGEGLTFSVCREYFWCVADVGADFSCLWRAFLVCCRQWG